jgi:uncharacterized protein
VGRPKPRWRGSALRRGARALLAAGLALAAGPAQAACGGTDLLQPDRAAPALLDEIGASARDLPYGRGTFFRLSKPGLPDSYLLGTVHLGDPRATEFPPSVLAALDRARVLVTEIALQEGGSERPAGGILLEPSGRNGSARLGRRELAELRRRLIERGVPAPAARRFRAGVLALLVDLPACATAERTGGDYAEARLDRRARDRGIARVGLESLREQVEAVSDLPPGVEGALLRAVVRQARRGPDVVETTLARYSSGETGRLVAWMRAREPIPGDPLSRVPPAFLDRLLDLRSARMADRLLPHLAAGDAFVAVGAAHLPGGAGLLKRIAEAGYEIANVL